MKAVLLGQHEPNTEPWHALRAGGIGASEIAAVVGLSPYVSAFWLWHFKKGNIAGQSLSDAMDWGHRLEPVVRQWWNERHDYYDVEPTPGTFAHADRPWQRCNPDGLIRHRPDLLLEIKTSRYPDGWGRSGTDEIPLHYRCQVQQSLDIFGATTAHLAVLIGGNEPREYVIEADSDDQRTLREAGAAFWESLQANDEPPIDCSDSTYAAVRELNPQIDPDVDAEIDPDLWAAYLEHKTAGEHHASELQRIKSQILATAGTARLITYNTEPVLRRQMSSAGTPYLKEIA